MSKLYDFDAFWAETMPDEAERHQIKVFGEVVTLPAVLPARVMLKALRYQEDQERTAVEQIQECINDLNVFVGADRVDRWLDQGMETTQIIQIYTHIIELYTPKGGDEGDEGNAAPPKTGEGKRRRQSSTTGA